MSTLRLLIRPTIFAVGVCGTCFCGAAIVQHEQRYRSNPYTIYKRYPHQPAWMSREWIEKQQNDLVNNMTGLKDSLYGLRGSGAELQRNKMVEKMLAFRRRVNNWYNNLTTGETIAYGTIFANFLVFCAWRINSFQPMMRHFFLSNVTGRKIPLSPMILSCFSHIGLLHFGFNMLALYSFANTITALLGPEETIGLFLSAGAISSLTSMAHRLSTRRFRPSLGASGAILGVVAYCCVAIPDMGVLLLTFIPVSGENAIKLCILADFVGVLAGWRYLDHAAHLGGTLFGIWYFYYGQQLFHAHKRKIVDKWVQFKHRSD